MPILPKAVPLLTTVLLTATAAAQEPTSSAEMPVYFQPWVAKLKVVQGDVRIIRRDKSYPGQVGTKLKVEDTVVTDADAAAGLTFLDNSTLSLGPESEVLLLRYNYDPTTYAGAIEAHVRRGTVSLNAGNLAEGGTENVRITTPKSELKGNAKQLMINVGGTK